MKRSIFSFISAVIFIGIIASSSQLYKVQAQSENEHRAVWLQNDTDLSEKFDKLRQAHINTIYFGIWGADHMSLQEIIDLAHSKGLEIHFQHLHLCMVIE